MKCLRMWVASCMLALGLFSGPSSALGIELSLGAWNQDPKGDFSYKALSMQDNLSVKDNLKYSDKTKISGRVKVNTPPVFPNIYLMATLMRFNGTGSKDVTFRFGNVIFNGNVPFTSDLRLDHYDIDLFYGVPGLRTATGGILNMDVGFDARIIDFKERVTGVEMVSAQTITQSESLVIPVPMLYLGMQVKPVKWLAVEGEVRGMTYSGNHYYDFIGRVKIMPIGPVFIATGYRDEKLKIDKKDVLADVRFSGMFAETGVEF